jgi:hypothetical protein
MTTLADFDPETALERLLAGLEEVVGAVNELTIALLTIETNDHRRSRQLLREMVATLTQDDFKTAVHRDWIRQAQQLVGPLEEPRPTAEDVRGMLTSDTTPLPTIQRDQDDGD